MTPGTAETVASSALTFTAYAARVGKSRPYISKLVSLGTIHGPALVPAPRAGDRLILPAIADQQIADASLNALPRGASPRAPADGTYAHQRALLTAAQRERAEMENAVRRGELIPRSAAALVIPAAARRYRDTLNQLIRDRIASDSERSALLADLATATEQFIHEVLTDGGALSAAA